MKDKQLLLDFVHAPVRLGAKPAKQYYIVSLQVDTSMPDPDEEYGGGFSVQRIYRTRSQRLCIVDVNAGQHVISEVVKRYERKYTPNTEEVRKMCIQPQETIERVRITCYTQDFLELYELPD